MKQGMNSVNRYLWDVLLYACMGCFSYFFLVHYADIPVRLQDRLMTFHTFLAVIVSFCGVGLSMRYINERLLTYYPYFLRNKRMLSAGLIAAAVILLLSNYLLLVSVKALAGVASPFHLQRSGLTVILLVWLVELVIVGQFILNRFYVDVVRLYKRAEELEESTAEARYRTLQNQLNPHFLFNALNTLKAVIRRDSDQAGQLVQFLSTFFRKNLKRPTEIVTLADEIEHVNAYLQIEKARFQANLQIQMAVPEGLAHHQLPAFTLQPIVENAIKHGTSQHLGVGEITIRASQDDRWLQLDIEDNAGLYRANPQASGLGMNLVDRRLRARFGADCGISVTCEPERFTRVTLRLPLEENAC